jgi:hypothetical protein
MRFMHKVLAYKKNEELSWIGHLLFTGLFNGEHKFKLVKKSNWDNNF